MIKQGAIILCTAFLTACAGTPNDPYIPPQYDAKGKVVLEVDTYGTSYRGPSRVPYNAATLEHPTADQLNNAGCRLAPRQRRDGSYIFECTRSEMAELPYMPQTYGMLCRRTGSRYWSTVYTCG